MFKLRLPFLALVAIFSFRMVLDWSYIQAVNPIFSSTGFKLEIVPIQYITSWGLFFLCLPLMAWKMKKVSDYFFVTMVLFVLVPLTSLFGLDNARPLVPVLVSLIATYLVLAFLQMRTRGSLIIPSIKSGFSSAVIISVSCVLLVIANTMASNVTLNFDFYTVYDYRVQNLNAMGGIGFDYLNIWTYQVFNTFLIAVCLLKRFYFLMLLLIAVQVFFYASSQLKGVLFFPICLIGLWVYLRKSDSSTFFTLVCLSLVGFGTLSFVVYQDVMFSSLFARRTFFLPSHLTYMYFEFFSSNQYVLWSNSIMSLLLDYPFNKDIPKIIGNYMNTEASMNNGFVSMGFAHAGYLGVFIYSSLIGMILRFIDTITYQYIPLWISLSLLFVPIRAFAISSDLLTSLLSHGAFLAILILFLLRKNIPTYKEHFDRRSR